MLQSNLLSRNHLHIHNKFAQFAALFKQDKFDEIISPTKGYLRETCKSQNINPIYLTLSSPSVLFNNKHLSGMFSA